MPPTVLRPPPRRVLLLLVAGLALFPAASAQTCPEALADAEAAYVEGAFGSVLEGLAPCFDDTPRSVPARRLVALSYLRLGQIAEAKQALLQLLAIVPTYEPDPVRDPPAYQSLVQVVQAQLAAAADEPDPAPVAPTPVDPRPAEPQPEPPPTPPAGAQPPSERPTALSPDAEPDDTRLLLEADEPDVSLRYWAGAGSYGGERGVNAEGPIREFVDNAGMAFGVGVAAEVRPRLYVFGDVEAAYYPTLSTDRGVNAVFDSVDVDRFSPWVRFVTAGARLTVVQSRGLALYGALGGGIAFGDRDLGGAVSGGVGVDFAFLASTGAFVDATWTFVGPARAIDAAASPSAAGDLFSVLRLGLRYRVSLD